MLTHTRPTKTWTPVEKHRATQQKVGEPYLLNDPRLWSTRPLMPEVRKPFSLCLTVHCQLFVGGATLQENVRFLTTALAPCDSLMPLQVEEWFCISLSARIHLLLKPENIGTELGILTPQWIAALPRTIRYECKPQLYAECACCIWAPRLVTKSACCLQGFEAETACARVSPTSRTR